MTILVTGGAGYIGSHTTKLLSEKGENVVVFDNLSRGQKENLKWGEFFKGDLANVSDIEACFAKFRDIKVVMHFAAYAYINESVTNPSIYYQNNVVNTINLLEVMQRHNTNTIIFSSTCATYGIPQSLPISEDHPQNPINPYGWSKRMIEQIIKDYRRAYDLNYVILRYFNAAGADLDLELAERHTPETHLIPRIVMAALGVIDKLIIFGTDYDTPDGTCIRDYIHVSDLAQAHVLAMDSVLDGSPSDIFNLGTASGFSINDIIKAVECVTGKSVRVSYGERRRGDPAILIANNEKANQILGWTPKYSDLYTLVQSVYQAFRLLIIT